MLERNTSNILAKITLVKLCFEVNVALQIYIRYAKCALVCMGWLKF